MTSQTNVDINSENLSNFMVELSEEQNYQIKAKKLNYFALTIQQNVINSDDDELKHLFFEILFKVPEIITVLIDFDVNNFQEKSKVFKEKIHDNIKCIVLCLESLVLGLQLTKTVEQLLSMLQHCITVLNQCYTHCKDSELLYGDWFEEFTDQLGDFFNKVQEIQAVVSLEIERLLQFQFIDKNIHKLVTTASELGRLSELVSSLDTFIGANLWRKFMKIVSHFSDRLQGKLPVHTFRDPLSNNIIQSIEEFREKLQNNAEVSDQDIKIFLFQLNIVMKLSHLFPGSVDLSTHVLRSLLIEIFELLVLCYSPLCESSTQIFIKSLKPTVPPMVSIFMSNKNFFCSAFDFKDTSKKLQISHLLISLAAVSHITSNKATGYLNCSDVLRSIFSLLQQNNEMDNLKLTCLKLPLWMFNQELKEEESFHLYEHAYLLLSKFSKTLLDSELEILENDVIKFLMSTANIASLLISDIWIYRLRCSSVKNLAVRCTSFAQKVFKAPSQIHLRPTCIRMFTFLPIEHILKIFQEHSSLKAEFLKDPDFTAELIHITGIDQTVPSVIKQIQNCNNLQLVKKACLILQVCGLLLKFSRTSDLLRFLEIAKVVFESEVFEIQLAVLKFLSGLKEKDMHESDPEYEKIASSLSSLLSLTMRSKNYIIRNEAFKNYTELARSIPHPRIFRQTLVTSPDLVPAIKSFLTNVPEDHFATEKDFFQASEDLLFFISNETMASKKPTNTKKEVLKALLPRNYK